MLQTVGVFCFCTLKWQGRNHVQGGLFPVNDFSGGDWIVEALKLFEQSPVLRRMFYAVVVVGLLWGIAEVLPGVAQLIGVLNG